MTSYLSYDKIQFITCICVWLCVHLCIYMWRQRPILKYLFQLLSALCFEQVLPLNLEPTVSARLTSQWASRICLSLPSWASRWWRGSSACIVSISLTELPPQPQISPNILSTPYNRVSNSHSQPIFLPSPTLASPVPHWPLVQSTFSWPTTFA